MGDNAFQGCLDTITGYASWHNSLMSTIQQNSTGHFNHVHSSRRIDVENSIGEMKEWAFVRGRSDIKLHDGLDHFESGINCVVS